MPIRGSNRPVARVPAHHEPGEGEVTAQSADANSAPLRAPRPDAFERPQMPVSLLDAGLNLDRSGAQVNEAAPLKHSLNAREILLAAPERKDELVRRYCAFLSTLAGGALSRTQQLNLGDTNLEYAGAKAEGVNHSLKLSAAGQSVTLDIRKPLEGNEASAALDTALLTLERLLFTPQGIDPKAAELTLFLVGGDGILTRGKRPPMGSDEVFSNPKLLCWDFNGTVEKFGDGRPRGDLARTSRAMQRRGATSLITTTISPEKPETFMVDNQIAFGGYYGSEEVRPTKGNKSYRLLAETHGISKEDAPARMVIVGDSKTDIPSDLPGTVFLHNDAMTPAPALELLLNRLDQNGKGSFRAGLDDLTQGPLGPNEKIQNLRLQDLVFDVEMRNGSNDENTALWVPTISNIRVALGPQQVADIIAGVPSTQDVNGRAGMHLALEHLAEGLEDAKVPDVIQALQNTSGAKAGLAAVDRRLAQRELEIEAGRKKAAALPELFSSVAPLEHVAQEVLSLLVLGDAEVASQLPAQVARIEELANAAESQALVALRQDAEELFAAALSLAQQGVPFYAGASPGRMGHRLERVARSPLSASAKQRKRVLELLRADDAVTVPGGREAAYQILNQLPQAYAASANTIRETFALRKAAQAEFNHLVVGAMDIAQRREKDFAAIRSARAQA